MNEISIRGILAGLFSYFFIIITVFIFGIILLAYSTMSGIISSINIMEFMSDFIHGPDIQNSVLILIGVIVAIEIITSIFSGYIAAKVSGKGCYINSGIVGSIIVGAWLTLYGESIDLSDMWLTSSSVPASLFGGYLVQRKIQSEM